MLYLFETTATMKEYNRRKWWIDGGIIRNITINADSITSAIKQYIDLWVNISIIINPFGEAIEC